MSLVVTQTDTLAQITLSFGGPQGPAGPAGTVNEAVTNIYTASGSISVTDVVALVNSGIPVAMTLANGATDGHVITIKRYGAGAMTITADIDGQPGAVITANSTAIKEAIRLAWQAGLGTWLEV